MSELDRIFLFSTVAIIMEAAGVFGWVIHPASIAKFLG
jgi:hypothetical protein